MVKLYPPIEPYDHGMLDVGDNNQLAQWRKSVVCHRSRYPIFSFDKVFAKIATTKLITVVE